MLWFKTLSLLLLLTVTACSDFRVRSLSDSEYNRIASIQVISLTGA